MKKIIFSLFCLISTIGFAQEQQYICHFVSEVKVTKFDVRNPKSSTQKVNDRYTFIVEKNNSASYINLSHGVKQDLRVNYEGGKLIFTEKNNSDNYFVVTIFMNKKEVEGYPAIYSFNSWNKEIPFYFPSIQFGFCK